MRKEYIERLVKIINAENLGGAFIAPSEEMKFFLGYSPILCERFQGLFITDKGEYF
jgi:hypothetical protein